MQIWRKDGNAIVVDTREPHVYSTENELHSFLRQYLAKEKSEHWLVFTRAEERILAAQQAAKPHIAKWPEVYLDNMVLALIRADGIHVRPCRVHSQPPDVKNMSAEHVAIMCNLPW